MAQDCEWDGACTIRLAAGKNSLLLYIMVTRAATVVTAVCRMSVCSNYAVLKLKSKNVLKQLMHYHTNRLFNLHCDWLMDPFSSR